MRRAAQRWRVEVRFQGSPGDRRQLHARCRPAQGRRCCPWSVLWAAMLVMLDDGMRAGEMHTAAAGAAELGEELGHAHDAICLSGSRAWGACPGSVEGRRWQRSQSQARWGCGRAAGGRAATCDGLSRGDGCGVEPRWRLPVLLGLCPTQRRQLLHGTVPAC
jgi:hypothetical protein